MEKISITLKELAYLAAELGAKELFGIRDPYYGMTAEEIHRGKASLQTALDQKGIVEMDFSGKSTITEKAKQLVSVCAFCDAYVVSDARGGEAEQLFTAYCRGGHWVLLEHGAETSDLYACDAGSIAEKIGAAVPDGAAADAGSEQFCFSCELIAQAQGLLQGGQPQKAETVLLEGGLNRRAAEILLDGLQGKGIFCTLAGVSFKRNEVRSLLGIAAGDAVLFFHI